MSTLKNFIIDHINEFESGEHNKYVEIPIDLARKAIFEDVIVLSAYINIILNIDNGIDYVYVEDDEHGEEWCFKIKIDGNMDNVYNYALMVAISCSDVTCILSEDFYDNVHFLNDNTKEGKEWLINTWDYIYEHDLTKSPICQLLHRLHANDPRLAKEHMRYVNHYLGMSQIKKCTT